MYENQGKRKGQVNASALLVLISIVCIVLTIFFYKLYYVV